MTDLSEDDLHDVMLVATELVANAYDHGQRPCQVRFTRCAQPPYVRVEVDDTSPRQPILGRSTVGRYRGRGLMLVDKIAKAWGATTRTVGKTVWATIPCTTT